MADKFLHLSPPARIWQHIFSHMSILKWYVPKDRAKMHLLQWQWKTHWPASAEYLAMQSLHMSPIYMLDGGYRYWRRGGAPKSLSKYKYRLHHFWTPTCLRQADGRIFRTCLKGGVDMARENFAAMFWK